MPRKYDFDLRWQFHNDLLKAYREVAPTCWQQQQAWRRVCESPAPRFYISGHALEEVIRRILYDGMGFLQSMGGNRRRMYEELWVRFSKMVTERPYCNMDMRSVCCILVAQPAPEFYCSPETVRSVFSRMRRKMLSRHVADSHRKPAGAAAGGAVASCGAAVAGGTLSACAVSVGAQTGGSVSASMASAGVGAASSGGGGVSAGVVSCASAGSAGGSSAQKDLSRGIVGVNGKGVVVLERGGCASVAEVTGDDGLSLVSARRSAFRCGTGLSAGEALAGEVPVGEASVGEDVYVDAAYSDALRLGVEGLHGLDSDGGELDVSMS